MSITQISPFFPPFAFFPPPPRLSLLRYLFKSVPRPLLLYEQNAITIFRPVIHYFFHVQTRGAQLLDSNILRGAVAAPVARNSFHRVQPRPPPHIESRPPPSDFQRPQQAAIKFHRLRQVMVHAPQKNRVAARRRQIRIRLLALHHNHVPQLASRHLIPQLRQLLRINLRRIHLSRRPHPLHCRKRVLPVPCPNIRRNRPRPPPHQLRQPPNLPRRSSARAHRKHQLPRQPQHQQFSFFHRNIAPFTQQSIMTLRKSRR